MKKTLLLLFAFCLFDFAQSMLLPSAFVYSQWVQQSVPVSKPITGIKFIDSLKGWAIADIGTGGANYSYILHTTNGGTNWLLQDSSFGASLLALSVVDINIIYCGGFDGAATANLHKTTNGGINWILIPTPTNMSILDMQFINKDSGWTVGGSVGADVRTTTDGGQSWQVRINGIASQTQRLFFLNYSTGFCVTPFILYKTTNTGLNWIPNGNFSNSIKSVFFLNQNTGWIGATNDKIFFTSNAGLNWLEQITPPLAGTTTDIYFINSQTGWAGNRTTYIFKTANGGNNWGYQRDTSRSYRVSIIDSLIGWSGDIGISRTINGGGPIIFTGLVNNGITIPNKFILYQNYPNPFNPTTTIKIDLPKSSNINLVICDMLGRVLHTITNEYLRAGGYTFTWDAGKYSSGIYFYRLITDDYSETKKMILIK